MYIIDHPQDSHVDSSGDSSGDPSGVHEEGRSQASYIMLLDQGKPSLSHFSVSSLDLEGRFSKIRETLCKKAFSETLKIGYQLWMAPSLADLAKSRPNLLSSLVRRFYGLQSRISRKIHSEPLMNARDLTL